MASSKTVSVHVTTDEKWPDLFVEETERKGSVRIPVAVYRKLRHAQKDLLIAQQEVIKAALEAGLSMRSDDIAAFLEEE